MNTATIRIGMLKEPDLWWELSKKLNLDDETFSRYFEFGDYGEIEVEVDQKLNIVGGRFIPCGKEKYLNP